MYIMNGRGNEIINSEFVERFCIVDKNDAALIVASYGTDRSPVTMARYVSAGEAINVLRDLMGALAGGQSCFDMPPSVLYAEERAVRDARKKRKGGS